MQYCRMVFWQYNLGARVHMWSINRHQIGRSGFHLPLGQYVCMYVPSICTVWVCRLPLLQRNGHPLLSHRMVFIASECSGPARFDWHGLEHVWVYRRTKAQLLPLLEEELSQLMGKSITLKDWCSLFFLFWLSSLFWARERDGSKQRDVHSAY